MDMSRTKKGKKAPGWETWSKRPNSCAPPGREAKKVTNRIERRRSKRLTKKELDEDNGS